MREETRGSVCGRSAAGRRGDGPSGSSRSTAAPAGHAKYARRPHFGGARGHRSSLLLRTDARAGGRATEAAPRNRQDADPLRPSKAPGGAGRRHRGGGRTGMSSDKRADILSPSASLQERLARLIAGDGKGQPALPMAEAWAEPEWQEVAPGISCKLLATDTDNKRVSMLVRLAPGTDYPPHTHAGVEELHLLDGELWIEDRKLYPGDYNRGEPGTGDKRVYSETGCTCFLVTSFSDILR